MTTATDIRETIAEPLRLAANLTRHFGFSPHEIFDAYDEDDLERPITDETRIRVSALGALILAHNQDGYGDYELPVCWESEPCEGWTGYPAMPVFALYLVTQGMVEAGLPDEYTAGTIGAWSNAGGRTEDDVSRALDAAADMVEAGTIPVCCTSCGAWFGWDSPLVHVSMAKSQSDFDGTDGDGWLILHDARAVCPAGDAAHRVARSLLLETDPPALIGQRP